MLCTKSLFSRYHKLLAPENVRSGFFADNQMRMMRLTCNLLPRQDEEQRFSILDDTMTRGQEISRIVRAASDLAW